MFRNLFAILAQHKRLSDVEATSRDLAHSLARLGETVDELRSDLDFHVSELRKLRGRVTGGSRKEQPPQEDNGAHPPDLNAAIKAGTYRGRR